MRGTIFEHLTDSVITGYLIFDKAMNKLAGLAEVTIYNTLMAFTKLAVLLATSLADCTKCLLATGLLVFDEARRHVLQRDDVCFATMVAADNTYNI